jgi:hypothetical protein
MSYSPHNNTRLRLTSMGYQILGGAEHHHRTFDWCTIVLIRSIHILVSTASPFALLNFEMNRHMISHKNNSPLADHLTLS